MVEKLVPDPFIKIKIEHFSGSTVWNIINLFVFLKYINLDNQLHYKKYNQKLHHVENTMMENENTSLAVCIQYPTRGPPKDIKTKVLKTVFYLHKAFLKNKEVWN